MLNSTYFLLSYKQLSFMTISTPLSFSHIAHFHLPILHIYPLYRALLYFQDSPNIFICKAPRNCPLIFLPLVYITNFVLPLLYMFTVVSSVSLLVFHIMPLTSFIGTMLFKLFKMLSHRFRILPKCTMFGESDVHVMAFLKSSSNIGENTLL